ncbi:MAG: cbb3-type cytochrome c oxidase N-terminal domain-containing protein [Gemmatimonadaceae bacterium]|jgi:cytochrome c oxidase cbb3-type subunit 3
MTTPNTPQRPREEDRLLEHEYDGIREYDNPMPRWWLLTFAGTIVFAVIYYFNVGPIGNGKGRIADYEASLAAAAAAHPAPTAPTMTPEQLLALAADHEAMEEGQKTFTTNCAACHRADGGGLIGPNLTDDAWIHGGTITDIYTTVTKGVLEKGMPSWEKVLKPQQLAEVVAYVTTLKGTHPANPKAPQGVVTPQ